MPGDQLQDQAMLLDAQSKKKPKKFVFVPKKAKKGEGFLPSGFETRNPG